MPNVTDKRHSSESSQTPESRKPSLVVATGDQAELEKFIERLNAFLRSQPAWALILAKPRASRKRMAQAVANAIFTTPAREADDVVPRALRRALGL